MDDIFMEYHKQKSKSSMSEAFKDADYASPITKFHGHAYHLSHYASRVIFPITFGLVSGFILAILFFTRG